MKRHSLNRRTFLQSATALTAAGGLSGLPGLALAQDGPSIMLWDQFTADPQYGTIESIVKSYAESRPDVTIKRSAQAGNEMSTIGKTALSSGTGPDIIYYSVGKGNAGVLADAGLIVPIKEYAEQYGWNERIAPFALQEASLDGTLYGLPHETEVVCFFVNTSLMEQMGLSVPKNFGELLEVSRQASDQGIVPIAYGQGSPYPSWWALGMVANQVMGAQGALDLVFENKGRWNTPEMVEGIRKFFVDLPEAGGFLDEVNALSAPDAWALFLSGGALMALNGSWGVGDIRENMGDAEIEMIALPTFEKGKPAVFPAGVGSAYYISAAAEDPDAAAAFLDYLISDGPTRTFVEDGSIIPPVEFDASDWDISGLERKAIKAAATGFGTPEENLGASVNHGLAGPTFLNAMTNGFQAMLSGDKTAEEQAEELQAAWEQDQSE